MAAQRAAEHIRDKANWGASPASPALSYSADHPPTATLGFPRTARMFHVIVYAHVTYPPPPCPLLPCRAIVFEASVVPPTPLHDTRQNTI